MFKLYVPNEFGKKDVEEYATRTELDARMFELAADINEGLDLTDDELKDYAKSFDWEGVGTVYSIYDSASKEVWSISYRTRESAEAAIAEENVNADEFEIFEEDDLTAMGRHNRIES